jgi:putative endonuclease
MLRLLRALLGGIQGLWRGEENGTSRGAVGRRGERAAARHLKRQGYRILERNFTTRRGEVDIVAFRQGVLAFVEVRSQTEPVLIDPEVTVTRGKQLRVIKAAQAYCTARRLPREDVALRFDVITVRFGKGRKAELRHIEDAFGTSGKRF